MDALLRFIDSLSTLAAKIATLGVVAMAGLMFVGVVFRYAVNSPLIWVDETVRYILVFTVMLGVADVMRRDENIKVNSFIEMLPPKAQRLVEIIGLITALAFGMALLWLGSEIMEFSISMGLTTAGKIDIPSAWVEAALPIGGALLSLAALARLIRAIRGETVNPPSDPLPIRNDLA